MYAQPTAMNTITTATLITTITALTRADSEMPIISSSEIGDDDQDRRQVDDAVSVVPSAGDQLNGERSCGGRSMPKSCSSEAT